MIEYIFIARLQGGEPALAKAQVLKDTPSKFLVDPLKTENLIGLQWTGSRISKSREGVFDCEHKALLYLVNKAKKYTRSQEVEVSKARSRVKMLEQMIEQGEESK